MSREPYLLPNGRILRYAFHERLTHWLAAVPYIYALLTGLAFWSPWLFWIAIILGGTTIALELHPWAGVIFVIAVTLMHKMWGREMHETPADKDWWANIRHYIVNEDDKMPSADRFNPGQKLLFWGFFWNAFFLLVSGLILWFPQHIPWNLRILRLLAVIVHPICALLTIALFIIHVYMGTAFERGSFGSVLRGDVSRAWADEHHHTWYERILRESAARK